MVSDTPTDSVALWPGLYAFSSIGISEVQSEDRDCPRLWYHYRPWWIVLKAMEAWRYVEGASWALWMVTTTAAALSVVLLLVLPICHWFGRSAPWFLISWARCKLHKKSLLLCTLPCMQAGTDSWWEKGIEWFRELPLRKKPLTTLLPFKPHSTDPSQPLLPIQV